MNPRDLRAIAERLEKLCIENSRGVRSIPCPSCKEGAERLRRLANLITVEQMNGHHVDAALAAHVGS